MSNAVNLDLIDSSAGERVANYEWGWEAGARNCLRQALTPVSSTVVTTPAELFEWSWDVLTRP